MKKILLLGDSIRIGYAPFVKEKLIDIAECYYPDENCRDSYFFFVNLQRWLSLIPDKNKIDIIHFNTGHWDINHWNNDKEPLVSISEYKKMMVRIVLAMKRSCSNAKILFSLTTPMNPDESIERTRTTNEIIIYNCSAVEVMKELDVPVNDLFTTVNDAINPSMYKDACHFTEDGYKFIAENVYAYIKRHM